MLPSNVRSRATELGTLGLKLLLVDRNRERSHGGQRYFTTHLSPFGLPIVITGGQQLGELVLPLPLGTSTRLWSCQRPERALLDITNALQALQIHVGCWARPGHKCHTNEKWLQPS